MKARTLYHGRNTVDMKEMENLKPTGKKKNIYFDLKHLILCGKNLAYFLMASQMHVWNRYLLKLKHFIIQRNIYMVTKV
jgi:hypothetical protein